MTTRRPASKSKPVVSRTTTPIRPVAMTTARPAVKTTPPMPIVPSSSATMAAMPRIQSAPNQVPRSLARPAAQPPTRRRST